MVLDFNGGATTSGHSRQLPGALVKACVNCHHYRFRLKTRLFSPAELQTPGGLKAYSEWQQQEKQHAEREAQLVAANGIFPYEPHHYAWCAAFTPLDLAAAAKGGDQAALKSLMETGGATVHPVSGEVLPIYALCIRKNQHGDCDRYESR